MEHTIEEEKMKIENKYSFSVDTSDKEEVAGSIIRQLCNLANEQAEANRLKRIELAIKVGNLDVTEHSVVESVTEQPLDLTDCAIYR